MLPIINKVLRKDKMRDGKCPIVLQVYFKKERKQIFTGLYIEPDLWDKEKCEAGKKHYDQGFFNQILKNKYREIESSYTKQLLNSGAVTIQETKKVSRLNFFDFAFAMFDSKGNRASKDYIDRSKAAISDFKTFAGDLNFQSITVQLLKDYENHLFKKGNKRNTVNRIFKRLKQVFTEANKEGITEQNPFNVFKTVTYRQPKRDFLTMEEINSLATVGLPAELELIRNYFLLSCFTGMRFGDLQKFTKEKFITENNGVERIIVGTSKTGAVISIKLLPNVKAIIDKINRPIYTNVHSNRLLKEACKLAEIKKAVSWHMSRHSFAVNSAGLGIPIEAVSRLLGHSNIKTTAIYYKLTDTKLDKYMDLWEQ